MITFPLDEKYVENIANSIDVEVRKETDDEVIKRIGFASHG